MRMKGSSGFPTPDTLLNAWFRHGQNLTKGDESKLKRENCHILNMNQGRRNLTESQKGIKERHSLPNFPASTHHPKLFQRSSCSEVMLFGSEINITLVLLPLRRFAPPFPFSLSILQVLLFLKSKPFLPLPFYCVYTPRPAVFLKTFPLRHRLFSYRAAAGVCLCVCVFKQRGLGFIWQNPEGQRRNEEKEEDERRVLLPK